jgi:multidrug efflux system outer membrane protein
MLCRTCFLLAIMMTFAGCSLAPSYHQPEAPVPATWPKGPAYQETGGQPQTMAAVDIAWQTFYIDPQLRQVITLALENNRDLRAALLRIERARAQYRIQRSDLFPKLDAVGAGSIQRQPADLSGSGRADTVHRYDVDLGVSAWELDLFGRIRSLKEQALEQYLATEQARRSIQVALVSDTAIRYLILAADRERLQLARETLVNQQAVYRLVKSRFEAGIANALDLNQARTSVDAARVDIARYTTFVAQDQNALDLLAGTSVADNLLPETLGAPDATLQEVGPGLSSQVLLRRPDILDAEHRLKGANANIGAARAAFFPSISLTSAAGTASRALSGLFTGGSFAWAFAPRITLPIFNAGENRARLQVAKVDRDIAVATYEKTIQTAFREVADALARRGTIDEQQAAQQSLTDANAESYRLSQVRYEKGVDSYLNVLDSQRSLYDAQQALISVHLDRLTNLVTLYRVLGGGSE